MLFDHFQLKNLDLPTRVVRSATCERLADADGKVTTPIVDAYRALAGHHVGLLITGHMYVQRDGCGSHRMVGCDRDACIPGLAQLAGATVTQLVARAVRPEGPRA